MTTVELEEGAGLKRLEHEDNEWSIFVAELYRRYASEVELNANMTYWMTSFMQKYIILKKIKIWV